MQVQTQTKNKIVLNRHSVFSTVSKPFFKNSISVFNDTIERMTSYIILIPVIKFLFDDKN